MAPTFTFKLGGLDLSTYLRVNPDDKLDPQGAPWIEPAFTETPFADGQPLISTTIHNREQQWPVYLKNALGSAVTNLILNPSFEYDLIGATPLSWVLGDSLVTRVTFDVEAGWQAVGKRSVRSVATYTTQVNAYSAVSTPVGTSGMPVTAGLAYTAAAQVNITSLPAAAAVYLYINWYNAAGALLSGVNQPGVAVTGVQSISLVNQVAPANAAFAAVLVQIVSSGAGSGAFYADAVQFSQTTTLPAYGDGDSIAWVWNGTPGNSTSTSLVGKDALHALIRQITAASAARPLVLEWRDDGSSYSTFFDVQFVRFEPDFNFRRSQHSYAAGILHVWTSGYGHTGTTRVTATAAGTGIFLSVPITSLAGDAPALLDTTIVSGAVLPSLGRIIALAPISNPSYTPQILAASLTDLQAGATLIGASGWDGSQYLALPVSPTGGASGVACKVPLPNPTIAGGDNRILAVVKSGIDAGIGIYALDPFGNSMGATAVASMSNMPGLVDLGVCRLPTVGYPTQPKISIMAGALWASGASGPLILASPAGLALGEILCLPDKNLTLILEKTGVAPYSRDGFARGGALNGQNDDTGNPWSVAWNNVNTASPGQLTENYGNLYTAAAASSLDAAHLAGILTDSMLISAKAIFGGGGSGADLRLMKESASGAYVQGRVTDRLTSFSLDLAAATNGTLNTLASLALATMTAYQKYRLVMQVQGAAAFVNLSRDDGGPVFIPGSAALASVGIANNPAVNAAGVPGIALGAALQSNTAFSWGVDAIPSSNLQAYDSYRIDGPNADSYRIASGGAFAGQKLVGVQRGAFPRMVPSTTSLAVVVAPFDQGVANDLISAAVSVRERFTYAQ